jgi:hypothetical protein
VSDVVCDRGTGIFDRCGFGFGKYRFDDQRGQRGGCGRDDGGAGRGRRRGVGPDCGTVWLINAGAGRYAATEAANASPLQTVEQDLLGVINAPTEALLGRPLIGNGADGAPGTGAKGCPGWPQANA